MLFWRGGLFARAYVQITTSGLSTPVMLSLVDTGSRLTVAHFQLLEKLGIDTAPIRQSPPVLMMQTVRARGAEGLGRVLEIEQARRAHVARARASLDTAR